MLIIIDKKARNAFASSVANGVIKQGNKDTEFQQLQPKVFKLSLIDLLAFFLPGIGQQSSNSKKLWT